MSRGGEQVGRGRAVGSPVEAGWLCGVEPQRPPVAGRRMAASAAGQRGESHLIDYIVKQKQHIINTAAVFSENLQPNQ